MQMVRQEDLRRFAEPLGRVALSYSRLEWSLAAYLDALQGSQEPFGETSATAFLSLDSKVDAIRKFKKHNRLAPEIVRIMARIKDVVRQRHKLAHGLFYTTPQATDANQLMVRMPSRGRAAASICGWSVEEIGKLAGELNDLAAAFSAYAYQERRRNKA